MIGAGLLSRINNSVTVTNVPTVSYNDSRNGANLTYTLTDDGAVSNQWSRATLSGVKQIELNSGLGDDTINSTIGTAIQVISGGGGTDVVHVTLSGSPTTLTTGTTAPVHTPSRRRAWRRSTSPT